jgi:hypothetical protein
VPPQKQMRTGSSSTQPLKQKMMWLILCEASIEGEDGTDSLCRLFSRWGWNWFFVQPEQQVRILRMGLIFFAASTALWKKLIIMQPPWHLWMGVLLYSASTLGTFYPNTNNLKALTKLTASG